ncbi:hypothetical protein MRX96_021239 [Rhipicephalus microplus]
MRACTGGGAEGAEAGEEVSDEDVGRLVDNTYSLHVAPGGNKVPIALFFDEYAEDSDASSVSTGPEWPMAASTLGTLDSGHNDIYDMDFQEAEVHDLASLRDSIISNAGHPRMLELDGDRQIALTLRQRKAQARERTPKTLNQAGVASQPPPLQGSDAEDLDIDLPSLPPVTDRLYSNVPTIKYRTRH